MNEIIEKLLEELNHRYNQSDLDDRLRMNYERGRRAGLQEAIELLLPLQKKSRAQHAQNSENIL